MRYPCRRLVFLLGACCLATASHAGSYRFVYKGRTVQEGNRRIVQGDKLSETAGKHEVTVEVLLQPTRMLVRRNGVDSVYDFEARTIEQRAAGATCATIGSLYADVSFRETELKNRLMLREVDQLLNKASVGSEDLSSDPRMLEAIFGIELDEPLGKPLELTTSGKWRVARSSSKTIWRHVPGRTVLPADARAALARYVTHELTAPPKIAREIAASGSLPARFESTLAEPGLQTETKLELESEGDSTAEIARMPPCEPNGELETIAAKVRLDVDRSGRDAYALEVHELLGKNEQFDAFLAVLEMNLATGADVADLARSVVAAGNPDPDPRIAGLTAALGNQDAAQALAQLNAIPVAGLRKGYVIGIFKANDLLAQRKGGEAEALFLAALRANPRIAGVYHDLGQYYLTQYEMGRAFLCFDTALLVAPSHPMLKELIDYERQLEKRNPQFF